MMMQGRVLWLAVVITWFWFDDNPLKTALKRNWLELITVAN